MRSGTNWAHNLLNLHPNVASYGEYIFNKLRDPFDEWMAIRDSVPIHLGLTREVEQHFERFIKATMYECVSRLPELKDREIVWLGDRSPRMLLPIVVSGSKHFRLIRDGRDVIVSWTYLNLAQNRLDVFAEHPEMIRKCEQFAKDKHFFQEHPEQLLNDKTWVSKIAKQWNWRANQDEMAIAKIASLDDGSDAMSIRYEDLHADTEQVRNKMYQFLELEPKLALPLNSGAVKTSAGLSEENPDSLYRKGVIGDWRNYFNEGLESQFREIAGDALDRNGYSDRL